MIRVHPEVSKRIVIRGVRQRAERKECRRGGDRKEGGCVGGRGAGRGEGGWGGRRGWRGKERARRRGGEGAGRTGREDGQSGGAEEEEEAEEEAGSWGRGGVAVSRTEAWKEEGGEAEQGDGAGTTRQGRRRHRGRAGRRGRREGWRK